MNTTITLFNSSNIIVPASDVNKWKEDISKKLNKIKDIEKRYKDEIDESSIKAYDLEKLCRYLYKNITDFEVEDEDEKMLKDVMETIKQVYGDSLSENCLKMYEKDISRIFYNIHKSSDEKSLKTYNDAISQIIHGVQKDSDEYIKSCNQKIITLKDQEKKIKYELSLVPSSIDDVKQNIYTFVQNTLNNISDDFNENYTAIIFNEIMDKQDDEKYEETISSVVTQHALTSIIKKMYTKIFKRYEEIMLKFASAYFQISDGSIYDKQKCIKMILHSFEMQFKEGTYEWLLYCTNSDTIPSFPTSVKAKSMTISRMQSYNQRIENSEALLVTKYLKTANETLDIKNCFDEEELKNASENIFKKSSSGTVEEMEDDEVPKPKVEKTIENFAKELGTRTVTADEITDAYNKYFGTNLAKVGVGRKISGSNLFVKDSKNRVTVYYVNKI